MNLKSNWIDMIQSATSEQEMIQLGQDIKKAGYTGFYEIQDYIREQFKRYDENDTDDYLGLVNKVKLIVPNPGEISPSWTYFWDELEKMIEVKTEVTNEIAADLRDGEWQVIIDNPFSHDNVACYPQLSFLEGVYLYCYFQLNLKKNEYVRLQKIMTAIAMNGK